MNTQKSVLFISILVISSVLNHQNSLTYSQSIFLPVEHKVHNLLERFAIKGIINTDSEAKPFTRMYAAAELLKVLHADAKSNVLKKTERDEVRFFAEEFYYELVRLK